MAHTGRRLNLFRRPPGQAAQAAPPAEQVLAALPTPVVAIDPDGRIQDANAAAEALLNLSHGAMVGVAIVDAIGHAFGNLPAEGPVAAFDQELRLSGRRHQRADLLIAPWPERPGWRILMLHLHPSAIPIARRAAHDGGTLAAAGAAAMLAHEIKNPLAGIRGAAQLLESGVDPEAQPLTRLIRDEVDRIAALIDRMEGFTDTRRPVLAPLNIHTVLDHARAVATPGFSTAIAVRQSYDPSLPLVLGDRDALVQVVMNLLNNAAEALGPRGGKITLTTAYRHGMHIRDENSDERRSLPIEVCVIDDGPGARADLADHMFDPFVTSKPTGRGLGLALVQKLVGDQGGVVEYAREGRPERTVFRILLPRADPPR